MHELLSLIPKKDTTTVLAFVIRSAVFSTFIVLFSSLMFDDFLSCFLQTLVRITHTVLAFSTFVLMKSINSFK